MREARAKGEHGGAAGSEAEAPPGPGTREIVPDAGPDPAPEVSPGPKGASRGAAGASPGGDARAEVRSGVAAAVAACVIWGLSSIFYKTLSHADPVEILAHRSLWGLIFMGGFCALTGRLGRVRAALAEPRSRWTLCISATMISANWFLFIWGVTSGQALEASLGYYVFPLMAAASAAFLLREPLSPPQRAAVGLAAAAVATLIVGLGAGPWLALGLALTFTGYGLAKRSLQVGPISSVAAETLLLLPVAAGWVLGLHLGWWSGPLRAAEPVFAAGWADSLKLAFSGALTATPLILFSHAAQRLRYATLGFIQYLNPTLQFLVAALLFGEVVTPWHAVAFPLIWTGLSLYSLDAWRRERAARRARAAQAADPAEA